MKKQLSFDVAGPYSSDLSFPEAGYGADARKKCLLLNTVAERNYEKLIFKK